MVRPMLMDILRQTKNKNERKEGYAQIIDDGGMERTTRPLLIIGDIGEIFTITDKIRSTDQKKWSGFVILQEEVRSEGLKRGQ
ncbi:hypothetical protein [Saccharococcus caldoxylosilyticus]|jgi:hypothetical protein|uniref:Uncharacterized protein n=1 Tax=Parageobacillus caldoxylosilyticus NBRC 107762 TaxID=1220594 RepID=A0A023DDC1_9BACL|nr:hypothetical protein [Parageobacillus caldoxylosilyticus]MBB3852579.1 hypothetical protein [Parageobacillus caldoxylosilyticus]GAJ39300.1 hypothetical protein GCA01S_016_00250 [Parageobacillus caldoxylosilyticus NBRC 107762]